ncbi:iron-sulfur cluster assembly 2 homolog, mitochondrial-like [Musca domestica]|uniref:Iron-sulfur cluster assembly 2 homolog, mitochondrial n=1 Tax=Musca domestica TaxID=7370 RepID=A0A1I8MJR8_MUSDO|nr:iron-sulfur cluster assembly 2 homolog, mitochondrial [Musca domestica]XP_058974231.1 iron-sulfur cluster assembly 2 homolog, mitochondrial [Musca domestica]XP_058976988.1 iron-sulfur cluster assembly 2 homolog, mitochondrial-like [Musca domestica]XP_058976989.1 iron-sulfur cluster assembly 2 homolog, mitochondrial-like [Musca domestica]
MASLLRNLVRPTQRSLCLHHRLPMLTEALNSKNYSKAASSATAASDQQLVLSDSCLKRLKEICGDGSFLRITVEGGGCSGFQYKFDLDNKINEDDLQFGKDDAKVVIDNVSLEYCNGATVDYHTELIRSGFRMLANPKAEQGCSCGSSFAIKLD